jgi:hypothetical protein
MLTGWPSSNTSINACTESIATPTQHDGDRSAVAHEIYATTTSTKVKQKGRDPQMETVRNVKDGLFDGFDDFGFDESLSQG